MLDFRILLSTLLRMVGVKGERAMWCMGLQRTVVLDAAPDEAFEFVERRSAAAMTPGIAAVHASAE